MKCFAFLLVLLTASCLGQSTSISTNPVPTFGPSGSSHAQGAVPDPGATAGTTRVLNENGTFQNVALPITPSSGGPLTATETGATTGLQRVDQLFVIGDSYNAAQGVNDYSISMAGLLQGDVPAPIKDYAVSGTNMDYYATEAINYFDPNPNVTNVSLVSGAENDGSCSSLTATCGKRFQLSAQFVYGWLTIPFINRTMASNCVQTSGTFTAYASASFPGGTGTLVLPTMSKQGQPGTAMNTTGSAVMTCTVTTTTATTKIGINYGVLNSSTSSMTVTVDGTSVTDLGSGTTTFSGAPIQTTFSGTQTVGAYRQEYAVTPGTTHTVVFTVTAGTTYPLTIIAVDAAVSNSASNNVVLSYATNQAWSSYAFWNSTLATLASNYQADGLSVNFLDGVNGITDAGVTYTFNSTTNLATVGTNYCSASTISSHPNSCGHEAYRELALASQNQLVSPTGTTGFRFSSANITHSTPLNQQVLPGPSVSYYLNNVTAAATVQLYTGVTYISGTTAINYLIPPVSCFTARSTCFVHVVLQNAGASIQGAAGAYSIQTPNVYALKSNLDVYLFFNNGYWYQIGQPSSQTTGITTIFSGATPNISAAVYQSTITVGQNLTFGTTGLISGAAQQTQVKICYGGTTYTVAFGSTFHISSTVVTAINAMAANTCAILGFSNYDGTNLDNTWSSIGLAP